MIGFLASAAGTVAAGCLGAMTARGAEECNL